MRAEKESECEIQVLKIDEVDDVDERSEGS
jgi:hypothetical protein